MWHPWHPWHPWWWVIMHHPSKQECTDAHQRIKTAAADLDQKQQELKESSREARHGARNIRMLLGAVLARLTRENEN